MISIIIPIYNAADYLSACLDSLLAQTEHDLQVVMVDDGSTDAGVTIAQSYTQRDPRFVLIQQSHAGQSAARNNGLKQATGSFIAFLDADDSLAPDWCERHLAAIDGVDYVQSGYQRVDKSSNRQSSNRQSIVVFNKVDAFTYIPKDEDDLTPVLRENLSLEDLQKTWMARLGEDCIFISAKNKENIDALRALMYDRIKAIHIKRYPYNDFLFQNYEDS